MFSKELKIPSNNLTDNTLCFRFCVQCNERCIAFIQWHTQSGTGAVWVRTAEYNLHIYRQYLILTEFNSVKVVTIITGGVQSRIARTPRHLVPNSLYHPIRSEYERRVVHSQDGATPNEAYARRVVTQVLYGPAPWRWLWPWGVSPRKWVWAGSKVTPIYMLSGAFFWFGIFNFVLGRMFNLRKLKY